MDIADMEIIGSGAEADIYLFENKAIKIFKDKRNRESAIFESELQMRARKAGLPVPIIYDVTNINGRAAIIMEYLKGKSLGSIILENMDKAAYYLGLSVDLQISIHDVTAQGFPEQKGKLKTNINSTIYLSDSRKQELLGQLQDLETGNQLCHGDFHVLNLLQTDNGIKIIDWVCASCGSISCDVCRTYLLYLLYRPEIAEIYLDIYCRKSGLLKQGILAWLPVIAGARLTENVTAEEVSFLLDIVDGGSSCLFL